MSNDAAQASTSSSSTAADIAPHRDAAWLGAVIDGLGYAAVGIALGLAVCALAPARGSTWATVGAVVTGFGGVAFCAGMVSFGSLALVRHRHRRDPGARRHGPDDLPQRRAGRPGAEPGGGRLPRMAGRQSARGVHRVVPCPAGPAFAPGRQVTGPRRSPAHDGRLSPRTRSHPVSAMAPPCRGDQLISPPWKGTTSRSARRCSSPTG